MPTQPTPARYVGTVYAELVNLLKNSNRKDLRPSIGMVQRLDRDTSGVMVFSIHQRAHKKMTEQFRSHDIDKVYWALVQGEPNNNTGIIISNLAKRRSTNLMVSVEKGGKYAETRYRLLRNLAASSLIEVNLITGRSHQIRAHFSEAGLPLLGDTAYGGAAAVNGFSFDRQMLHARSLAFHHPVTGAKMSLEAPVPDDFDRALTFLEGSLNGEEG
jgi:23S rRNA pseudouridine1911/1915/1917 synthase